MIDPTTPPEQPILLPPVAPYTELGEGVDVIVPAPTPDELAYTGPLDVVSVGLGALVLLYAGLALLGRPRRSTRSTDSGELGELISIEMARSLREPYSPGSAA